MTHCEKLSVCFQGMAVVDTGLGMSKEAVVKGFLKKIPGVGRIFGGGAKAAPPKLPTPAGVAAGPAPAAPIQGRGVMDYLKNTAQLGGIDMLRPFTSLGKGFEPIGKLHSRLGTQRDKIKRLKDLSISRMAGDKGIPGYLRYPLRGGVGTTVGIGAGLPSMMAAETAAMTALNATGVGEQGAAKALAEQAEALQNMGRMDLFKMMMANPQQRVVGYFDQLNQANPAIAQMAMQQYVTNLRNPAQAARNQYMMNSRTPV